MSLPKIVLILLLTIIAASASHATESQPLRDKLIGLWDELPLGTNLVEYTKDGTWKLYLQKGEIGNLHAAIGTWTLAADGTLKMTLKLNGENKIITNKLSFDHDQMILALNGDLTRHRRHKGPIPARFVW
jgi:hypothetical protein